MSFKEIPIAELSLNPFEKIGKEWFLVTAGDESGYNTMTASWGFTGVMWNKNVFITVIRPNRYTYEFIEKSEYFTASFLPPAQKPALNFCGSHSGRNCDKAKEAKLTPVFFNGATAFEEADLIFICKKLYSQDMDISLLPKDLKQFYQADPMHKQYIGEITKVLSKSIGN
ncbi:MAG: flavin reductase [Oscillospiraceae bacterium]|nr:flavin reductase [Oscillospiraceae bacterium]